MRTRQYSLGNTKQSLPTNISNQVFNMIFSVIIETVELPQSKFSFHEKIKWNAHCLETLN